MIRAHLFETTVENLVVQDGGNLGKQDPATQARFSGLTTKEKERNGIMTTANCETFPEMLSRLMRSMYKHPALSLVFAATGIMWIYAIATMIGGPAFYYEEWPIMVFAGIASAPVLYLLMLDETRFCKAA